jgi:hypothetical protein
LLSCKANRAGFESNFLNRKFDSDALFFVYSSSGGVRLAAARGVGCGASAAATRRGRYGCPGRFCPA